MLAYLKRLVTTGAAYQFGDILAKGLALLTLPLYTHHLAPQAYGAAESLLTAVILSSILLRVGVGEAFIRFYFDDDDPERRQRIARTATAAVAWTTTVAALAAVAAAGPLSRLLLSFEDPLLLDCAVLGLWAFTNLEMAYAQLRVDERARAYVLASAANVAMTVAFTITLVVFAGEGARGLLLGNFAASTVVVLALWWVLRARFSLRVRGTDLRAMLRFGLPTVPADASVYALQVADRFYLYRSYSHGAAGVYAVAIKLATVVFVAVRGFQYAWPPLAYSIESDEEAGRLYSLVTTYYALATGVVVCAVALLGRWMVRLLAAHQYFNAYRALP
ncbi:MAG TPA: oligosaccharide flippase family protein, partial [Solirubrobacteraceae bacterium]|nr:oligosaccharide flippase family protein [Solirubrobacteraceae bacterium]